MPRDDNDYSYEIEFFKSRGRVKNPRIQKRAPAVVEVDPRDQITIVKKKRSGRGNAYQYTKTGSRVDLGGIIARSSWEADTMRILQLYKIEFLFEPKVFTFPVNVQGKMSAYLPDIYLVGTDEFIEVKGMLDGRGRAKLRKFKKYYPEEFKKLIIVISKSNKANKIFFTKLGVNTVLYYEHLVKLFAPKIYCWEGRK